MKSSVVSVERRPMMAPRIGRNVSKDTRSSARCSCTNFFTSADRCTKLNQENVNEEIRLTRFCWVLSERPHDVADVGDGDLAVTAVVVEQEGLLELGQLVFRELLLHPARHVC